MIRAIIVEDVPLQAAELAATLRDSVLEIVVVATCTNVEEAFVSINTLKPDLVFLDIELEGYESGFDLIQKYEHYEFGVIFTSRYDTFDNARRAIQASALDFLTKPAKLPDIEKAVDRFLQQRERGMNDQFEVLVANLQEESGRLKEICISNIGVHKRVEVSNILYCEAKNVSTVFHLLEPIVTKALSSFLNDLVEDTLVSSKILKYWEQQLSGSDMCRIHRSYLVNLKHAVQLRKSKGGSFIMKNGLEIPISRERKGKVEERWNSYRRRS